MSMEQRRMHQDLEKFLKRPEILKSTTKNARYDSSHFQRSTQMSKARIIGCNGYRVRSPAGQLVENVDTSRILQCFVASV
uniref:Uncharacterized protein n=1 Tax=Romanomermis culicivorax TaxID=13658 RepID=A0A915L4Q4_ROMCU